MPKVDVVTGKGLTRGTAKLRAAVRHRAFVRAFLGGPEGVRGNGGRSALAAGYLASTSAAASVKGSKLLARSAVQRLIARHLEREDVSTQRLLHELASVALAQISDVIEWDEAGARLVASSKLLDDDTRAAVQEVEQVPSEHGTRVRVRMHDKVRAIEVLLRAKRAVGDDVPREFTLVIGRTGVVQINAGPTGAGDGAPLTLRLGEAPSASGNGDEAAPPPSPDDEATE